MRKKGLLALKDNKSTAPLLCQKMGDHIVGTCLLLWALRIHFSAL